jgi:hypothetical protein
MELGAPLCPAIRKEMGLTNWPPRPKIHTASYLWASETLKHVDCLAQKIQVSDYPAGWICPSTARQHHHAQDSDGKSG